MERKGDILYDLLDSETGQWDTYEKVTVWRDGTPMDDGKADGVIYRKSGTEYFRKTAINTRPISVTEFGAKGYGTEDDTPYFEKANQVSRTLYVPLGVYNLKNWEPLPDTEVIIDGATIQRYDNTEFQSTGATAAIVLTNDNIIIDGGKHTEREGLPLAAYQGSILINGGANCAVRRCELFGTWGAVFGPAVQNGSALSRNLSITDCHIHDNSHNTWLSDIDGLTFSRNHSYNSLRDGLRTHRNCKNIIIDSNVIYNNGNGELGQSQDGMDLFWAGERCIITNNIIYNNGGGTGTGNGIDIKTNIPEMPSESVIDREYIICNNYIFGNSYYGISIQNNNTPDPIENLIISGNHIFGNTLHGLYMVTVAHCSVSSNIVYKNNRNGIELRDSSNCAIYGNHVYDNGVELNSAFQKGIVLDVGINNAICTGNVVESIEGNTQTVGIRIDNGICVGNISRNHSIADYTTDTEPSGVLIDGDFEPVDVSGTDINWALGTFFNKEISSDTTLTVSRTMEGKRIELNISNTDTDPHDITITDVTFPVGNNKTVQPGGTLQITLVKQGGIVSALSWTDSTNLFGPTYSGAFSDFPLKPGLWHYRNTSGSTGYPSTTGASIRVIRENGNTNKAFEISAQGTKKLSINVGTGGTAWGGWQNLMTEENYFTPSEITGTSIDFTVDGPRYKNIAADTAFSVTNMIDGKPVEIQITNTDSNPHTVEIDGWTFPVGAVNEIPPGGYAHISLQYIIGKMDTAIVVYDPPTT